MFWWIKEPSLNKIYKNKRFNKILGQEDQFPSLRNTPSSFRDALPLTQRQAWLWRWGRTWADAGQGTGWAAAWAPPVSGERNTGHVGRLGTGSADWTLIRFVIYRGTFRDFAVCCSSFSGLWKCTLNFIENRQDSRLQERPHRELTPNGLTRAWGVVLDNALSLTYCPSLTPWSHR